MWERSTEDPGDLKRGCSSSTEDPGDLTRGCSSSTEDPGDLTRGCSSSTEDPGDLKRGCSSSTEGPGDLTRDRSSSTEGPGVWKRGCSSSTEPFGQPGAMGKTIPGPGPARMRSSRLSGQTRRLESATEHALDAVPRSVRSQPRMEKPDRTGGTCRREPSARGLRVHHGAHPCHRAGSTSGLGGPLASRFCH